MTREERPMEPNNASENPEQWAEIAQWEYERAEQLQRERDELRAEIDRVARYPPLHGVAGYTIVGGGRDEEVPG